MSQQLICETHQPAGCGQCKQCLLFVAGTHPDFMMISSEEGKAISVDAIRTMLPFMNATAAISLSKVVLITDAHLMNQNAANAILKVLEEPANNSYIILQSSYPQHLLATIKSRCQHWSISLPSIQQGVDWLSQQFPDRSEPSLTQALHQSGQRPQLAAERLGDAQSTQQQLIIDLEQLFKQQVGAVELAQNWSKQPLPLILAFVESCLVSSIKLQTASVKDAFIEENNKKIINFTAKKVQKQDLFTFYDKVSRYNLAIKNKQNLNALLLLEDILIHWYQLIFEKGQL